MSMAENQAQSKPDHKDFFISYTDKDRTWAEWIAMQLEAAGYTTIIQAWDIRPGSNFVTEMDNAAKYAERTIPVFSFAYLESDYAFAEWAAAFRLDPTGKLRKVLPVHVEECVVTGLLGPIAYIDLVGLDETRAREQLLAGVKQGRAKPASVSFPDPSASSQGSGVQRESPVFPDSLPLIWDVPYPRNLLFTGREELLTQLATTLQTGQPTALSQPQAISGLGGIGKTQIALEYAYRFRHLYHVVLWAQADTRDNLISSYLAIATLLHLPEKDASESARVVAAVKEWLRTSTDWLLILDNADDLALVREFVPPASSGHVLLTTRAQAIDHFAQQLEVDILPPELGTLFLLRRAGRLGLNASLEHARQQEQDVARTIYEDLGGLPLALDQAGAYIKETPCSLAQYYHLFQQRRADLLAERGGLVNDHPSPVATTWSLSFTQVEQKNPAAADLLRLCASLAPDAIPETIITKGASHLGPHLASVGTDAYLLNQSIRALRAYSLIEREVSDEEGNLLSIHRLVQAVLYDAMEQQSQKEWAERVVYAINAAFPHVEHQNWPLCERLLPHAKLSADRVKEYDMVFVEAARLLNQTGFYLQERARYQEAEPLYVRALVIREQQLGAQHPSTATALNNLAELYSRQGRYAEAEPVYVRALAIVEQQLGAQHPSTATCLNNLAGLYESQGKYAEAEPVYVRALVILEAALGQDHPRTQTVRANYTSLLKGMGHDRETQ